MSEWCHDGVIPWQLSPERPPFAQEVKGAEIEQSHAHVATPGVRITPPPPRQLT
jgi:hypothetical protein